MDLGPISAIHPVPRVRPSPPGSGNPDLAGVFAIEFRNQQPDDSYSPSRSSARGLEDEEEMEDAEFSALSSASSINFFA